jgi:selenocysteine lyase/cysteine desulfurase
MEDAARKLTQGVRLLAVGAASNALGTVNDVAQLTALAHAAGALVFVDGVHYAAHDMPDVRGWDCDFLACSAYKFYGPHVGVLWGRQALLDSLDAPRLTPATPTAPDRLETGTLNHEGIVGAGAAIEFLASLAPDGQSRRARLQRVSEVLHERADELIAKLWHGLGAIRGVKLYGRRRARRARRHCRSRSRAQHGVDRRRAGRTRRSSRTGFHATTVARLRTRGGRLRARRLRRLYQRERGGAAARGRARARALITAPRPSTSSTRRSRAPSPSG